ncbi:MAG TPA: hypothetical protein V6D12_00670 [Candidatus Obscuribacterales bacterium]
MKKIQRWLQIAEYVTIIASVIGAVVAVISFKVIYVAVPVSVALLLNIINRSRFEQQTRKRTNAAIIQMKRQFLRDIESLQQQVGESASIVEMQTAISTLQDELLGRLSQSEAVDLVPLYEKLVVQKQLIPSLQEQCASLEEALNIIINYLNSSSLPTRVDYMEKAIAPLSQEISRISSQVQEIDQRLRAMQTQTTEAVIYKPRLSQAVIQSLPDKPPEQESSIISFKRSRILQVPKWSCVNSFTGHSDWVRSLAISEDGQTLVSGSFDKTIKVWDLPREEIIHTLADHTKGVFSVAISPVAPIVASGSWDETIKLWNMDTGELINTLIGHNGSVRSIAISRDGSTVVSGSFDKTIKLWSLDTGELIGTLNDDASQVYAIALSPDDQIIASGGDDGIIRLWRLDTGEFIGALTGNLSCVCSLAISPDAQTIAASSVNGAIALWHLGTGERTGVLKAHSGQVTSSVFSPNGQNFISGSTDGTIKIWHLETSGKIQEAPLQVLTNDSAQSVISIAISPNCDTLATGSEDGTIKIWQRD